MGSVVCHVGTDSRVFRAKLDRRHVAYLVMIMGLKSSVMVYTGIGNIIQVVFVGTGRCAEVRIRGQQGHRNIGKVSLIRLWPLNVIFARVPLWQRSHWAVSINWVSSYGGNCRSSVQ